MKIRLIPKDALKLLLAVVSILLIINVLGIILHFNFEGATITWYVMNYFDFNQEANIPAFYSAIMLLVSSVLLFLITYIEKKRGDKYLPWLGLALLFLFLSLDEATEIHEALIGFTRKHLNTSGYFHYAWIIPYGAALIVMILIYLPFFLRLPRKVFRLFVLSGAIFVTGAIGFEMLGGKVIEEQGFTVEYAIYYTFEELLEMVGVVIFIFTLLGYIASHSERIVFVLGESDKSGTEEKEALTSTVQDA
ncbi:multidrug transporter [Negadavirga shengliensis]|uniref:Multidrug transporter n=1 Tax=Negadavirga shengliensis TaxID=1389218 RepID=A0ABV9T0V3_9BACT